MHVCLCIKSNILSAWLFGTNCYLLGKRRRKLKVLFYLHLFLPLCSSFLYTVPRFWPILFSFSLQNYLEHFLKGKSTSHEFPVFVCLRKSLFVLHFWNIISPGTGWWLFSLNTLNISLCILLACMVSEEKFDVIFIFVPLYWKCHPSIPSFFSDFLFLYAWFSIVWIRSAYK